MSTITTKRLPFDARTYDEVYQYFQTRHLQIAPYGYNWSFELTPVEGGYLTKLHSYDGIPYSSFFVTEPGRGYGKQLVKQCEHTILTINDCQIVDWLKDQGADFDILYGAYDTPEYRLIEQFYGDQRANRSGVFYMNHIDEGIFILKNIDASPSAIAGFCLHPLVQLDPDIKANLHRVLLGCDDKRAIANALEYRNIANAYLSAREVTDINEIALSPIEDVNLMLVADKIQNFKDFLKYHYDTHPRSRQLSHYFRNWFDRLGEARMGGHHWISWVNILDHLHKDKDADL